MKRTSLPLLQRRTFIAGLGASAAWPLAARAQQRPSVPVIGYLNSSSASAWAPQLAAFLQGLREAGYQQGRNVAIAYRWAEDENERLPELAADLVRRQVNVLVANGPAAQPAKAATTTIPLVFTTGSDPVQLGLVASLNRPGGNVTGVTTLNYAMGGKRLQLLHELVSGATSVALLVNQTDPRAEIYIRNAQAAASTLGLQLDVVNASSERDLDAAFATAARLRAAALALGDDAFLIGHSAQLAGLAVRYALPTIGPYREFPAAGGLISYGDSLTNLYRQAALYTARILKGEKPEDLPVQQGTKEELVINLKTAKTLGLTIPLPLLGRADEVIE